MNRTLLDSLHQMGGDCVSRVHGYSEGFTFKHDEMVFGARDSHPEILFRNRFEGTRATSSRSRLLVLVVSLNQKIQGSGWAHWKSRVRRG